MDTKFDSYKNLITWDSWKTHAVVDTKSGLLIFLILTSANHVDKTQAIPLVKNVNDFLVEKDLSKLKYWIMDSSYDYTDDIYEYIFLNRLSGHYSDKQA